MNNMDLWTAVSQTPKEAQKPIKGGRLNGFTDINPVWRFRMLTEVFGPCGTGWKFVIRDRQLAPAENGEVKAFVSVDLYYKENGEWSEAIPGEGGSSFVSTEKGGKYVNDECYKMALSDAIGTACKALGMSADIYFANGDRTKYTAPQAQASPAYQAPRCEVCGKPIEDIRFKSGKVSRAEDIARTTKNTQGKQMCYYCWKKAQEAANDAGDHAG